MDALLQALMTKTVGSALATAVGSRIYLDEAKGAVYPNVVFLIVSSVPDDTFTEQLDETLVQFSLRSTSEDATEMTGLYANLTALFDDAILTLSSGTCLRMVREGLSTNLEDITTVGGGSACRHWAVTYRVTVQQ